MRTQHRAEDLFDLSRSIDTHLASMAGSDEQAVAGTTSGQIGLARGSRGGRGTSVMVTSVVRKY